jgi:hypothetical protein
LGELAVVPVFVVFLLPEKKLKLPPLEELLLLLKLDLELDRLADLASASLKPKPTS